MIAVRNIRAKNSTSSHKVRAADDKDSEKVEPIAEESVEAAGADHAPAPPGMGKLVDRMV